MSASDDFAERVLEERAARFARRNLRIRQAPGRDMVFIRIDQEQFAIVATAVERVVPMTRVVQVPGVEPWLPGVIVDRDTPISLLDLRPLLGEATWLKPTIVVITRGVLGEVGIVAHELVGLREVRDDEVVDMPKAEPFLRAMTRGMTRIIDQDQLTLDPRVRGEFARAEMKERT